jgi:hypothetical protein
MDWFKGKPTGNHRFSHEIWGFPVKFPLNQSIESWVFQCLAPIGTPTSSQDLLREVDANGDGSIDFEERCGRWSDSFWQENDGK